MCPPTYTCVSYSYNIGVGMCVLLPIHVCPHTYSYLSIFIATTTFMSSWLKNKATIHRWKRLTAVGCTPWCSGWGVPKCCDKGRFAPTNNFERLKCCAWCVALVWLRRFKKKERHVHLRLLRLLVYRRSSLGCWCSTLGCWCKLLVHEALGCWCSSLGCWCTDALTDALHYRLLFQHMSS